MKGGGAAVAVVALLVVHNLVTNLWAEDRWYVRANLATAGAVLVLGRTGLPLGRPWPLGVGAAGLVVAGLLVAARLPSTRPLLADRRMAGVDALGTAWRALVRIPLGTVVLEEVAFRGVLPVLLSPVAAAGLFGLWHILPAARTLETNGARARWPVSMAVVAAAGVGLVLWELRLATGGLVAPALVHVAANSGATVAAYLVMPPPGRGWAPAPAAARPGPGGGPGGRPGGPWPPCAG